MLYDPSLEQRLAQNSAVAAGSKLAPTIAQVRAEGDRITSEKDEYKHLLSQLAGSDFVKEMKNLRASIIE